MGLACNAFSSSSGPKKRIPAYNDCNYRFTRHAPPRPIPTSPKPHLVPCGSAPRQRRTGFNFWSLPMSALFSPTDLVVPFENLRMSDVEVVGGKNASLGEMISQLPGGVRVPGGFATTAHAFRQFLAHAGLAQRINARLGALDTEDVRALAAAGAEIRGWVEAQPFPADLEQAIRHAFAGLSEGTAQASLAVRSSATAEDLPDASFAGQQETFLNVAGVETWLLYTSPRPR